MLEVRSGDAEGVLKAVYTYSEGSAITATPTLRVAYNVYYVKVSHDLRNVRHVDHVQNLCRNCSSLSPD